MVQSKKNVHRVSTRYGKTDMRYWSERLFKVWRTRGGARSEDQNWSVKLQHSGKRENFSLGTPNKAIAAGKARDIYVFLVANGWDATLAKYKSPSLPEPKTSATVGAFLSELEKSELRPKTLEGYAIAFRKIVADIFGLNFGELGKGWREAVHAVRLDEVTPARVQEWKRAFLAKAGNDPVKQRTAKISVNTFLRRSKSLFAADVIKHAQIKPESPFRGVDMEPRQSMRYRSSFDVVELIQKEREELATKKPEQYKILLLAVAAGLRRREIDTLEWKAFRSDRGVIRIEATEWFHPKSEDSIGDVEIDPELFAIFETYRQDGKHGFVVESDVEPKLEATYEHYRCQHHFRKLAAWLKNNGVQSKAPLHALRKEFGSRVNEAHGIHAASMALRHADLATTAAHYLDRRKRATPGLGHLLG